MDTMNLDQKKNAIVSLLEHQIDAHLAAITKDEAGVYSTMDPVFTEGAFKALKDDVEKSDDIDMVVMTAAPENPDTAEAYAKFKAEDYDLSKYKFMAVIRRARTDKSREEHPYTVYVLLD